MKDHIVKTVPAVLFAIPGEVMEEADIGEGNLVQFTATEGKIVIDRVDDVSDYDCDNDCENCPVDQIDCDNDCDNCPCQGRCVYSDGNREVE